MAHPNRKPWWHTKHAEHYCETTALRDCCETTTTTIPLLLPLIYYRHSIPLSVYPQPFAPRFAGATDARADGRAVESRGVIHEGASRARLALVLLVVRSRSSNSLVALAPPLPLPLSLSPPTK